MRTFIAIELPEEIKGFLSRIQEKLKSTGADVKWVDAKNIHLTLKFLGEVDDKKLSEIYKIMEDSLSGKNIFKASLSCTGAFPKINYPRVIWVGIDKGADYLKEIAQALEEKTRKIGLPKEERPFTGHITIGRVKSGLNKNNLVKELGNLSAAQQENKLEFPVAKITLFKSTLTPKGPVYEVIKEAKMGSDLFFT